MYSVDSDPVNVNFSAYIYRIDTVDEVNMVRTGSLSCIQFSATRIDPYKIYGSQNSSRLRSGDPIPLVPLSFNCMYIIRSYCGGDEFDKADMRGNVWTREEF